MLKNVSNLYNIWKFLSKEFLNIKKDKNIS